jgi:PhoPQ-activated pathogenicity-related protein/S-formylglutathione hydrolase FrmB
MKTKLLPLLAWGAFWLLFPAGAQAQALPVKTVEFNSDAVGRKMKYNIVLPAKYEQSTDRYPVLYLLHGLTSNYTAWARMGVPEYARAYDLIVVMPDVGNSWYVNWAKSEADQKNRWEDYVVKDLISHIDSTYRTIARREGRAINGLSMGGYGGLMLGLKHPDLFCSIGSHSGAIAYAKSLGERLKDGKELPRPAREPSTTVDPRIGIEGFSSQAERSPKGQIFVTAEDAAAYDPFQLVLKVPHDKLPHVYLDCGTEDRLIESNQAFLKLLMDNKIPFTYAQSGGGHTPPYWAREVGHSMAVQYSIIQRSLAAARKAEEPKEKEPAAVKKTPLDDYVAKADPTYSWKLVKTIPGDGCTTFVVDLKSQSWRAAPEVDRAVWQHWLVIVKPDEVKYDTAFLRIGGGRNGGEPPDKPNPQSVLMAKSTNSVVADLSMIPNQPLTFNEDGKPRSEDDLIAYCHIKFMDTGDPTWLPRLPMVKSAVRAMDTVTELLGSDKGGKTAVTKFVVAGGSKRGWTTWLTGAVDSRVVAIVPLVIDVLNVRTSMINHFEAYGFWAPAVGDYTRHKIHERFDTPRYAELLRIVDPYSYRDRLTMPKFIVNSAGDQYFTPDSSKFYFDDLPGVKYLRYVPNTNHSLANSDAADSVLAFYQAVLKRAALPQFTWKVQPDGSIRVQTRDRPKEVNLWQATNPKARDFRLLSIGPAYEKSSLEAAEDGVYVAKVKSPAEGWTAFFVELVYDSGEKVPYKFTTQVHIVPDKLPHSIEEFRKTIK